MGHPAEHVRHGAAFDHPAAIHHQHPPGVFGDHAQRVADQDQRHAAFVDQVADQVEDLALDGDVEGRGRLVGQQDVGVAGQGDGDHHPLALAARHLVRIGIDARRRVGDADAVEQAQGFLARRGAAEAPMQHQRLGDLAADGMHRVQAGHRLLEDHRDAIAANAAEIAFAHGHQVLAVEAHRAAGARPLGQEADQAQRGHRLAAARFADDAEGFAPLQRERDAAHRIGRPARGFQRDMEVFDFEQRGHDYLCRASLGSIRSRRPSPSRFRPSTDRAIARPG